MTPKKKKILFIDLGGSMGGVEGYLEGLAAMLHPSADQFALCALEELAVRLRARGVRVFQIPLFARARFLRYITAAVVLSFVIVAHRIDVVQLNGFLESILLLPARLLGCETVYTRHGPFEIELFKWYRNPAKFFPRFFSRLGLHLSSRLVCVSETVGRLYTPLFPPGRVAVIPNWVNHVPDYHDYNLRPREESRPVQLIYVGRLERYKGLHLLLEAIRGMAGVRVDVVGDGSYRPALEKLAEGLDVRFVGFQRDPKPYYANADIFVMPSLGPEGLPLVALEAMAHAIPCLFSDLPVHSEITGNGRAAMLFRSGDVNDLREKITSLVEDRALRASLAQRAYQNVTEKYHMSVARPAYLQLFEVGA